MRHVALLWLVLAACEQPNARLTFTISDNPATNCGSTSCRDIPMPCDAVISIRIIDPDDPVPVKAPCEVLPSSSRKDACPIESATLGDMPLTLKSKTYEFQIVVWPRAEVEVLDADGNPTGQYDCAKHDVKFDAIYGFPVAQDPAPALGGHAFYHPGDDEIRVELGCPNLESLKTCIPELDVEFSTSVRYFDTLNLFVQTQQGKDLSIAVGEPALRDGDAVYSLKDDDLHKMKLDESNPFGALFKATFPSDFIDIACVQTFLPIAQSTATVKCSTENVPPVESSLLLPYSVLLPKATLDGILLAMGTSFPVNGMTIGVVVDKSFAPLANETVETSSPATIRYLSEDRTNLVAPRTSSNGVFVSTDAEFKTRFSVPGAPEEIGGRIKNVVTIVVIQKST